MRCAAALLVLSCTPLAPGTDERFADAAMAPDARPDAGRDAGSCADEDGDGYGPESCGGLDCDDADPSSRPFVQPTCRNGVRAGCNDPISRALATHLSASGVELGPTEPRVLATLPASAGIPQLALVRVSGASAIVGAVAGGVLYLALLDPAVLEPMPIDVSALPGGFIPESLAMRATSTQTLLLLLGTNAGAPQVWFGTISGTVATGSSFPAHGGSLRADSPAIVAEGAQQRLAWRVCDGTGCQLEVAIYTTAGGVGPRATRSDPSHGGELFISSSDYPGTVIHDLAGPVWSWATPADAISDVGPMARTTAMFSGFGHRFASPPAFLITTPGSALGVSVMTFASGTWSWAGALTRPGGFGVLTTISLVQDLLFTAHADEVGRELYLSAVDASAIAFIPPSLDPAIPLVREGELAGIGPFTRVEAAQAGDSTAWEIWIAALTDDGSASSLVVQRLTLCFAI